MERVKKLAVGYLWHKALAEDFYNNLDEALNLLVDSEDRLQTLAEKYSHILDKI